MRAVRSSLLGLTLGLAILATPIRAADLEKPSISLSVGGKTLVRVRGHGRDCSGGTADSASDVFYEWNGKGLTPAFDASTTMGERSCDGARTSTTS